MISFFRMPALNAYPLRRIYIFYEMIFDEGEKKEEKKNGGKMCVDCPWAAVNLQEFSLLHQEL